LPHGPSNFRPDNPKTQAMKPMITLLLLFGIFFMLCGCKKKSSTSQPAATASVFSNKFDTQADLAGWISTVGGEAVLDNGAVKFQNITSCFHYETASLIAVQQGKTYILKITGKVNYHVSGDPMLCAGDFLVEVIQEGNYLVSESFGDHPALTTVSYAFTAATSASIKIKFLIGTSRGAWIDNIELVAN